MMINVMRPSKQHTTAIPTDLRVLGYMRKDSEAESKDYTTNINHCLTYRSQLDAMVCIYTAFFFPAKEASKKKEAHYSLLL